jgi:hypothetical protein
VRAIAGDPRAGDSPSARRPAGWVALSHGTQASSAATGIPCRAAAPTTAALPRSHHQREDALLVIHQVDHDLHPESPARGRGGHREPLGRCQAHALQEGHQRGQRSLFWPVLRTLRL